MKWQTNVLFWRADNMGVITILLVSGIGVFLFWFFEGIVKELAKADDNETEYVFLRRGNNSSRQNPRYTAPQNQRNTAPQRQRCTVPQIQRAATQSQRCTARPSERRITVRRDLPVQDIDIRERISTRRAS